jgi:hypothetical protein
VVAVSSLPGELDFGGGLGILKVLK